jgi:uncharacterized protein (TIGR00106 family)
MRATAEIQVIPIGVGVSLRGPVARAHRLIAESGLRYELHAFGTNVEGEVDLILATVARIHAVLHEEGAPRLVTSLKLGTRVDHEPSLAAKVQAVRDAG